MASNNPWLKFMAILVTTKKMENNKNEITQFIEGVVQAKSAKTT